MLNDRLAAARAVAPVLHAAKADAEQSLAAGSQLVLTLLKARADAKIAPALIQDALEQIAAANTAATQMLRHLVDGHKALAITCDAIGLNPRRLDQIPRMAGDFFPCPDFVFTGATEQPDLRVVA